MNHEIALRIVQLHADYQRRLNKGYSRLVIGFLAVAMVGTVLSSFFPILLLVSGSIGLLGMLLTFVAVGVDFHIKWKRITALQKEGGVLVS